MAEEPVVASEEVVLDDAAAASEAADDAAFDSGFENEPTVTPPAGEAEPETVPDAPVVPEVKYRQVTEDEWTALQAKSAEIDQIRADQTKLRDTAFGKVGGIERTLATLQAATPAGHAVEVTDDMFADLKTEFPELGDLVLKGMRNVAKGLKGTAPAAATLDPQAIEAAVTSRLVALQTEALEDEYADWRDIVGAPDSNNEYRQWLAKQPAAYQEKLGSTNSAAVIAKSITKFKSATTPAADTSSIAAKKAAEAAATAKAAAARTKRLEAAETPRGTGGAAQTSAEDPFEEGFKSG